MYPQRSLDYIRLEEMFETKIITYVTGDRPGWETQIGADVLDYFLHHLDLMGNPRKITLLLYTRGGNTLAGWSIVNLIRQFCDDFEIIVPSKAHSTGTLMCLGANQIIMTKQSTLGPIDPSLNTPMNPIIPGPNPNAKYPVSVEAIRGYFELAKSELGIKNEEELTDVFIKLVDSVHPLVLGQVYRARTQIQMLARKLLIHQALTDDKVNNIISFLASDSGSHDYTIYRREAHEQLGLNIIKPTQEQYNVIKRVYNDFAEEMKLNDPFSQEGLLGGNPSATYNMKRCLLESIDGGMHYFSSEGEISRVVVNTAEGPRPAINDNRNHEGWRFENVPTRDN